MPIEDIIAFSSKSNEWETPQALFNLLHQRYSFIIDVCATKDNTKCDIYFDKDSDGLNQRWSGYSCWMNPPYGGQIIKWVEKAHIEGQYSPAIIGLVPARTDTAWWWKYVRPHTVSFLKGRLKFSNSPNPAPFPCAIVNFSDSERTFYWDWKNDDSLLWRYM